MNLRDKLILELKKGIIGQFITCPATGAVLDIRTARFLVDSDGDPAYPLSPEGFEGLSSDQLERLQLTAGLVPELKA